MGEIDLIMKDSTCFVLIEVKYRSNHNHIDPIELINAEKIKRIKNTYTYFCKKYNVFEYNCRIDILYITGSLKEKNIVWVKNIL